MNRLLATLVILAAFIGLSSASTFSFTYTDLGSSSGSAFISLPNGYISGSMGTQHMLYSSVATSNNFDCPGCYGGSSRWTESDLYSSDYTQYTTYNMRMTFGDPNGNSGTGLYMNNMLTDSQDTYLDTVTFPLLGYAHIYGGSYNTMDFGYTDGTYTFDCRALIAAGLSGGCSGSDTSTSYSGYNSWNGLWYQFDVSLTTGEISNYSNGPMNNWSSTWTSSSSRSWPDQPFQSSVPEPTSAALIGTSLIGLGLVARWRRPYLVRTGLPSGSGKHGHK